MLPPNTLLQDGRYRIIRQIGQGGMGAVYEAIDRRLDNRVALKQALVDDPMLRHAFKREAQRLARLRHSSLPTVIDHFLEGGGQYLVMEFIEGKDLAQQLAERGKPFPVDTVLEWGERLLTVLTYLHNQTPPLIHRDIKPGNLKLTPDGEIILLDFGLSKGGLTQHTASILLQGYSLGYAPPEQMVGAPTDARSDLYSLGATLYTLVTAKAPLDGRVREQAEAHGVPDPLLRASVINPQVPPAISAVLAASMSLAPDQRPASAAAMKAMLKPVETTQAWAMQPMRQQAGAAGSPVNQLPKQGRVSERPGSAAPPAPPLVPAKDSSNRRRQWLPVTIGGIIGLTLILGLWMARRAATANDQPPASEPLVVAALTLTPTVVGSVTAVAVAETAVATVTQRQVLLPLSSTSTPIPTATIPPTIMPPSYLTISLADVANATLDFQSPPLGEVRLGGIPFNQSAQIFKSQASSAPHDSAPTSIQIETGADRASRIYLLITTGNGFRRYESQVVGRVVAYCDGERTLVSELRLGQEVREWQTREDDEVVSTAPSAQEVWSGQRSDVPELTGHIDMLPLDLPDNCRRGRLDAVEVLDISADTVGSLDPALNVMGLTIEYQP